MQSYGSFLSRQGNNADALKVFAAFDEALPHHPLVVEATSELNAGKKLPLMVDTPQAGAAEVLYGLGAALGRRGGEDLGLIYLQLSLYLAPSHPLALLPRRRATCSSATFSSSRTPRSAPASMHS